MFKFEKVKVNPDAPYAQLSNPTVVKFSVDFATEARCVQVNPF